MNPSETTSCPTCGTPLASPTDDCAQCLLGLGFPTTTVAESRVGSGSTPRVFGEYEIFDEIARGGMGVVYRARQRNLDRTVALKLILGGQLATRELVHRFRAEAAAAAALQHPNIVAIHDVGVHDGSHYFSMEYVQGQNLAQLVRNRPLPPGQAARYLKAVAEAIHYAHEQGILHRDLKPSNVLVDAATDQPRVTDFGLAKWLDGESSLTRTGQVLGSPNFMPPEQASHQRGKMGRASDVYALGGILYFLLTARPPFLGESLEAILGQVYHVDPVPPRLLNPAVPRDLESICLQCLNKEPGRRYPTAQAMGEDLGRFMKGIPTRARPTTRLGHAWRWCRRKPALAGALTGVALLLLILAIGSPIVAVRIQHARRTAEAHLYGADLNLVQQALAKADVRYARELLDRHRPRADQHDPRGFEWRYLWNLCQGDEMHVFEPRVPFPRSVVFSHDGHMLAAGSASGDFSVVWNLSTKAVVRPLPQGDRPLAFASGAPLLVTGGSNGLKRWNTQTWQPQALGPCRENAVAIFGPDDRTLLVYGAGLQVWDTLNGDLLSSNTFGSVNFWVARTLSVSRDGSLVCYGSGLPYATDAELRLFRLPTHQPIPWSERLPKDVSSAVFHTDQDLLITGGWSGHIRLWDTSSGRERPSIMKQTSRIMAMALSPTDSNLLATTGGDRSIHLWDIVAQQEQVRLHGAEQELEELVFAPNGQTLATGGHQNPVTLWNAAQRKADILTVPTTSRNAVLGYSTDGKRLLTIDTTGQVRVRDATSLAPQDSAIQLDLTATWVFDPTFLVAALAVSPDAENLAFGKTNGTVEIWNMTTRTHARLQAHVGPVRGLAFSPNSRRLITAGNDHALHLWDLATGSRMDSARLEVVPSVHWALCLRYSPDGTSIAVGSGEQLTVFRASDLQVQKQIDDLSSFLSLRFSPDGRFLASGHGAGELTLAVWDIRTWSHRSLPGHELVPSDITFSPDGRRMVSSSDKLVVWDTDTWQQLATYPLPVQDTGFVHFSPDGNDLITSDASALRVWRAPSVQDIADQETRRGRWR